MRVETHKLATLNKAAAGVAGAAAGIFSTLNTAAPGVFGIQNQVQVLVGGIIGPANASTLFKTIVPIPPSKPTGISRWVNPPVIAGITLLVADQIIEGVIGTKHGYSHARPWFLSLGAGFLVGGLLGAALDPTGPGRGGVSGFAAGGIAGTRGFGPGGAASRVQGFAGTYTA